MPAIRVETDTDPRLMLLAPDDTVFVLRDQIEAGERVLVSGQAVTVARRLGLGHKIARKGIRNVVAVAYLVECAHHVARQIAGDPETVHLIGFPGCFPNPYAQKTIKRICTHPNVDSAIAPCDQDRWQSADVCAACRRYGYQRGAGSGGRRDAARGRAANLRHGSGRSLGRTNEIGRSRAPGAHTDLRNIRAERACLPAQRRK